MSLLKRAIKEAYELLGSFYWMHTINQLASISMGYVGIIYLRRVIDQLTIQQFQTVMPLIIQLIVIDAGFLLVTSWLGPKVEMEKELIDRIIRHHIPDKMGRLQYHYADSAKTKDILFQLDITNYSSPSSFYNIARTIPEGITSLIHIIWSVALLWPMLNSAVNAKGTDSHLSILLLVSFIVFLVLNTFVIIGMQKRQQKITKTIHSSANTLNLKVNYEFSTTSNPESGKEIRLYQLSTRLKETMRNVFKDTKSMFVKMSRAVFESQMVLQCIIQLSLVFVIGLVGYQVLTGMMMVGMLVQVIQGITQLFSHCGHLSRLVMQMTINPEPLDLYYQFMDLPEAQNVGSLPVEKRLDNHYHLSTDHLTFSYPSSDEVVLKDISADFEVGKTYAIVGENGSGKSTFIKLLMRLYEPTSGDVLLNGIEADKYYLQEYFDLFSVIFQDFDLLSFTIGENIAVSETIDYETARKALVDVNADQFVNQLPKQLDTYIGTEFETKGKELSGGQRQKIAMARALYKDAPVMIMDEPTAALDPVAEFEIYQNMDKLVKDKTAFFISHRLSSCRFSDEILVFDDGEIVQRGRHEELVKVKGKYQELWQAQAQYYQEAKEE